MSWPILISLIVAAVLLYLAIGTTLLFCVESTEATEYPTLFVPLWPLALLLLLVLGTVALNGYLNEYFERRRFRKRQGSTPL